MYIEKMGSVTESRRPNRPGNGMRLGVQACMSLSFAYCRDSFVPYPILSDTDCVINIQSEEEKLNARSKTELSETEQRDLVEEAYLGASVQLIVIWGVVLGARTSHCGQRLFPVSVVS